MVSEDPATGDKWVFWHFLLLDSAYEFYDKYPRIHIELWLGLLLRKWYVNLVATKATKEYLNGFVFTDKCQVHQRSYKNRVIFSFIYWYLLWVFERSRGNWDEHMAYHVKINYVIGLKLFALKILLFLIKSCLNYVFLLKYNWM